MLPYMQEKRLRSKVICGGNEEVLAQLHLYNAGSDQRLPCKESFLLANEGPRVLTEEFELKEKIHWL